MKPFAPVLAWLTTIVLVTPTYSQDNNNAAGRITPKELSIPASPIFDLMGVVPTQITRTSDIKDFKVDWSFKSYKLSPNFAIQSQPVWELFYNRKDLAKYQQASGFARRLASMDISLGTVQNEENDRRIGAAIKLNVLKQRDPLLAKELYAGIAEKYRSEKETLEAQLREQQHQLDSTRDILAKPAIRQAIRSTEEQLLSINSRRSAEINERASIYVNEYWNASWLDVAAGKVSTYTTGADGTLLQLKLNRNTAWSFWLNGGFGVGKYMLISALLRTSVYEEQVNFKLRDKGTGDETQTQAVADNELWSMGINLRYGGPMYTFFAELLYERRGLKTAGSVLQENFKTPGDNFEVVTTTIEWTELHPYTINFGGDWRINRNVILNYGIRSVFDSKWKSQSITPIVTISCMMR